ncbi:MAG TPA: undecaprenyl-phosphate glucose phosphotransferase [Bacillota bacterium]|nr:undecaprenyl-phosphate glucose phosphotransferase [Bacillota bacterium]
MIKQHQKFFNLMLFLLDGLVLTLAYFGAYIYKWGFFPFSHMNYLYLKAPLWMIPLLLLVYFFMEVYSPMRSRMFRKETLIVIRAHTTGMVLIYGLLYLFKQYIYSRIVLFAFGILGIVLVLSERYVLRRVLRHMREKGYNQKHLLIIGAGRVGQEFARKVLSHREFGYAVIGYLDDDSKKAGKKYLGSRVLGDCASLTDLLESQTVDEVIVALPLKAFAKFHDIVDACEKAGVRVRIIPDYFDYLPGRPRIEEFDEFPLLNIRAVPLDDPFNRFIKRAFDIAVALTAIILTSPILLVLFIGVKLSSPGPVFFRQERVGLNNRAFQMLKFRSMRVAADNSADTGWTTAGDPRKTKFGAFIRKTSLDELPQFFNVLAGEMSVVGPRPERPFFVEQFREQIPKYMVKHQVKPGITGWAQVNGWRGDTSIEKRIECDIYYIENWDLILDIKIMILTIFKGLINKNAY